ncbi:MAG TPA: TIGR04255 family protein [Rhodocyclaceae bacterium]|nr:TIGR04255 family protein [Rhodocyclaceae bacterium]HNM85447.1 TIGR04255 family protein [Mycobacterium sp.]
MGDVGRVGALPSYDRPPVVEVAVGIHFLQLPGLNAVELVRLVDFLWKDAYPTTLEQPILPPTAPMSAGPIFAFGVQTGTPPIRLWSLTENQAWLIQVQHDRLLLNWRKLTDADPYPRYEVVRKQFVDVWQRFYEYISGSDFGVLQPSAAEVSFFNRIPLQSGAKEIPNIICALNPDWDADRQVATAYQLERDLSDSLTPGQQSIALNYRPSAGPMQLEIATRIGITGELETATDVFSALDKAHQQGVLTFDELTTDNAHSIWGRRDADNA